MEAHHIVGIALLVAGILDPVIGWFVVAPRVADPGARRAVMVSLFVGGVVLVAVGALFLAGVIPLG